MKNTVIGGLLATLVAIILTALIIGAYCAIAAALILAFIAAPSFWGTFWLVLVILIGLTGVARQGR